MGFPIINKNRVLKGKDMTYVATIYIPVKNPNRDMRVFSKECALEQLENILKKFNIPFSDKNYEESFDKLIIGKKRRYM